jgi:hypothetical protein
MLFGFSKYSPLQTKLEKEYLLPKMKWADYDLLLHHNNHFADSLLKSRDFTPSDSKTYTFSDNDGTIITLTIEYSGVFPKAFDLNTNDSSYCDEIYSQVIDDLSQKKYSTIRSSSGELAYFEKNRLFRINFNNYKYSHFGLHVISD